MNETKGLSVPATAGLAVIGPAAIGLAVGMPLGLQRMLIDVAAIPAIVVGLGVMMVPALYIAATLSGIAPGAQSVLSASVKALRCCGAVCLGLAPATLFVLATTRTHTASWLLGAVVLAVASVLGLRSLYASLFSDHDRKARCLAVFVPWALVALGLGAHLFSRVQSFEPNPQETKVADRGL